MINFKKKLLGTLLALTIMGILFATSSELVGAPVPGGPGFLSIGSYEFKPFPPDTLFAFQNSRLYYTGGGAGVFFAPAHLPHGATITQLVLYFVDNGTSGIEVYFTAYPLDSSVPALMVNMATSEASPDLRTLAANTFPNGDVIDNQSTFYFIIIRLPPGSNYQVAGVRIDYKFPISLPLIMK